MEHKQNKKHTPQPAEQPFGSAADQARQSRSQPDKPERSGRC